MRKIYLLFILSSLFSISFAQIGIGTDQPKAMVDVRGDLTIKDKIYVGGSDTELGDPGLKGQILVSQGEGSHPEWKSLNIPIINPGDFYIVFIDSYSDEVGISFNNNSTIGGDPIYNEGDLRSNSKFNKWKDIQGLTKSFDVYNNDHKVSVTYETVVQLSGQGSGSVDFACGVFINEKLKGVRVETIRQAASATHAFNTFLMTIIAKDVPVGENELKIACGRIRSNNNYSGDFSIGRAHETNINNFVAQSALRIEIYEIPEIFVPVVD